MITSIGRSTTRQSSGIYNLAAFWRLTSYAIMLLVVIVKVLVFYLIDLKLVPYFSYDECIWWN